jgi:hypothetical protein
MADILPISGVSKNVKQAFVNTSSTGNTVLVAAAGATTKIRVLAVVLSSTLANTVKFQSATTDKTATFPVGATSGFVMPFNEYGWFETAVNEALNFNMSVATATGVHIDYCLVN